MYEIDWGNIKLVIFDVDGTLYDQHKLRWRMFFALIRHFLLRPHKLKELFILKTFRKEREKKKDRQFDNLELAQYEWCHLKTGVDTGRIRAIISYWMQEYPLRYLPEFVYPGIHELFSGLKQLQIPVAILSDYPAEEKLKSMGLNADFVVSATHPEINSLKPDPKGLLFIAEQFNVNTQDCLYIGDRHDTDQEAARRAGMNCILADRKDIYQAGFYNQILTQLAG